MKLTFSAGNEKTNLEFVEFRKVRGGKEEVEISTIEGAALGLTLVLPTDAIRPGTASVSTHIPGHGIKSVAKVCSALKLLQKGCELEVVALKLDAKLCTLQIDPLPLSSVKLFLPSPRI